MSRAMMYVPTNHTSTEVFLVLEGFILVWRRDIQAWLPHCIFAGPAYLGSFQDFLFRGGRDSRGRTRTIYSLLHQVTDCQTSRGSTDMK